VIEEATMEVQLVTREHTRRILFAIAGSLIALAVSDTAFAQTWPSRTITAVVPFTAGSGSDVIARIALDQVSKQIGGSIIIENRGGAGGTIGAAIVAQAAADGYTLLASGALAAAHGLYPALTFSALRDFIPVIPLGQQPLVLVTAPSKGFKTLDDLIAAALAKPGALNFASAGLGSPTHIAAERFRIGAGFEAQHIPFRGSPEALTDVLAGRADFYLSPVSPVLSLINEGKLVALAVSTSKRATALPRVPTMAEAGLRDAGYDFWVGLYLPANTPRDIVNKLHNETETALRTGSVQERLAKLGVEPMPMSQAEFDKFFRNDVEANAKVVKAANIRVQQ
jgi:tripartite-type tricarboxylate transporter receptor subunit TctC